MGRQATTVVVGGGCSGVLAAIQLLRDTDDRVVMVEPGSRLGGGLAYGTEDHTHLLNSRAAAMSAVPDAPDHFLTWAREHTIDLAPTGFGGRRDYGRYLGHTLDRAAATHAGRFHHLPATVTAVTGTDRPTVILDTGHPVPAHRVVLAVGHARPPVPAALDPGTAAHPRFIADPWQPGALDRVRLDAPVLLVGTGLTAVDMALSLVGRGLRAPIHAVSRHGLLPQAHLATGAVPHPAYPPTQISLSGVVRELRSRAGSTEWRPVVDGLRPHLDGVWSGLSLVEQRRFLRHLARFWEVHRHRMAPQIAILVQGLVADGLLTVHRAQVRRISTTDRGFAAVSRTGTTWHAGTVINCCGPGTADRTPLGRALLGSGTARPDPLGFGLDVDSRGHLVARDSRVHEHIVTIGPARRGHRFWETTAVPEIRAQAADIARTGVGLPVAA